MTQFPVAFFKLYTPGSLGSPWYRDLPYSSWGLCIPQIAVEQAKMLSCLMDSSFFFCRIKPQRRRAAPGKLTNSAGETALSAEKQKQIDLSAARVSKMKTPCAQ